MESGHDREAGGWRMLAGLLADSHLLALELLLTKASEHAAQVGFTQVLIYLADLQREVLRPLTGGRDRDTAYEAELPVDGSVAGRAYQYGTITAGCPHRLRGAPLVGPAAGRHRTPRRPADHHGGRG